MRVFYSLAGWAWRGKPEDEKDLAPHFWSAALTAVGIVLIAAPRVALVFESMFLSPLMAALLAAPVSGMLAAMTPALEILRRGLGRALPILCAGLFVGFAVAAALTVRHTERIPRPASFQYLQDFDKGQAYWVAPARTPDPWTELVAGGRFQAGQVLLPRSSRVDLAAAGGSPRRGPGNGIVPFPPDPGRFAARGPPDRRRLRG
jgi:hypothetical protein